MSSAQGRACWQPRNWAVSWGEKAIRLWTNTQWIEGGSRDLCGSVCVLDLRVTERGLLTFPVAFGGYPLRASLYLCLYQHELLPGWSRAVCAPMLLSVLPSHLFTSLLNFQVAGGKNPKYSFKWASFYRTKIAYYNTRDLQCFTAFTGVKTQQYYLSSWAEACRVHYVLGSISRVSGTFTLS